MRFRTLLTILTLVFFISSLLPHQVFAQEMDYLEDQGDSLWEEERFLDVTGSEFETSDSQYVGEEEVKAAEAARKNSGLPAIDLATALENDKAMLPDNIMYGIGTGALIGGWFALVEGGTARDNVRFLTIGVLAGVLLGVAIGNKSLLMPQAPGAQLNLDGSNNNRFAAKNPSQESGFKPQFFLTPKTVKLDLQFNF